MKGVTTSLSERNRLRNTEYNVRYTSSNSHWMRETWNKRRAKKNQRVAVWMTPSICWFRLPAPATWVSRLLLIASRGSKISFSWREMRNVKTNLIVSANSTTLSFAPWRSLLTFSSFAFNRASNSRNLATHLPSAMLTLILASSNLSSTDLSWVCVAKRRRSAVSDLSTSAASLIAFEGDSTADGDDRRSEVNWFCNSWFVV